MRYGFFNSLLVQPILFKTVVYTFFVFVARLLEAFVHYLIDGGVVGGGAFVNSLLGLLAGTTSSRPKSGFWFFLVYITASEMNDLMGDGELFKIIFTRRSSELKSTRRARIRSLVRLSRLTDATRSTFSATLRRPRTQNLWQFYGAWRGRSERSEERALRACRALLSRVCL